MNAAFEIGAATLRADQKAMEVLANNVANVNTPAFKRSDVRFAEVLAWEAQAPGQTETAPTAPMRGGSGVRAAVQDMLLVQGEIRATGNPLDLAIDGQGMIELVGPGGESLFWRGGALRVNADGLLSSADGLGMPQTPPNAVLTSLALFMTAFVMGPTLTQLNDLALQPLLSGTAKAQQAMEAGAGPLREFMLANTRDSDLEMIYRISETPLPTTPEEVEILKLTPAFMLNELRVAFTIGFVVLLPFLLIDLVVASILLSLGMMMVPPTTISLPIKVLMFVLIDGWSLVMEGLLGSFA